MTTPRIGDTIHYTDTSGHGDCYAAIITNRLHQAGTPESTIALTYFSPLGPTYRAKIAYDPGNGWEDFTPGTWHHLH